MKCTIHVYRCTKSACRNVQEKEGSPRAGLRCEKCGSDMNKISERKVE
ncbi:hypothetical protein LCGC14_2447200 [marine sediment metagenome]|uniref:Uncharacterized protein n=1 Tax=marine sediment metagenome TaxID=412755 RepID=A0A0F9DUC9_9ZZZZ